VHSAEGWEGLSLPEIERQQERGREVAFRGDAAFARPEVYEALEARGVKYAIRIPANARLERDLEELLPRPVGRPSQKPDGALAPGVRNCGCARVGGYTLLGFRMPKWKSWFYNHGQRLFYMWITLASVSAS